MTDTIIVTKHPTDVEYIAQQLGRKIVTSSNGWTGLVPDTDDYPIHDIIMVLPEATRDDVRGKVVYGNLPFHLAVLAKLVYIIEFDEPTSQGVLTAYKVRPALKEQT